MWRFGRSMAVVATVCVSASRSNSSFTNTRPVQKVPTVNPEDAEGELDDAEDPRGISALEEDESVVELTEAEMRSLPKTYRKTIPKESCLSLEERKRLTGMIFKTHYLPEGTGKDDRAMWYQSALEVKWLEEWARGEGGEDNDTVRRAVKKAVLERVDLHKPLAYIIGHQPFYGCNIRCIPPLLCPRPETEMWSHWLVHNHLSHVKATENPPLRVLDMCCGTGCVGISLAVNAPHIEVVAVDIMDEAVKISEENARLNGLDSRRYRAIKSDMFETFIASDYDNNDNTNDFTSAREGEKISEDKKTKRKPKLADAHVGSFDIIVSNPPYVLPEQYTNLPPGIKLWESKLALVGDAKREKQQYLYFQELCELGSAILKPKARRSAALASAPNFIVEVGLQAERVASLMERSGLWGNVEIHLDYAQQLRWISATSSH